MKMSENKLIFGGKKEKDWLKGILRSGNVTIDFIKKDGLGEKLQKKLIERSKNTENWVLFCYEMQAFNFSY
jgi:hypothetical protein